MKTLERLTHAAKSAATGALALLGTYGCMTPARRDLSVFGNQYSDAVKVGDTTYLVQRTESNERYTVTTNGTKRESDIKRTYTPLKEAVDDTRKTATESGVINEIGMDLTQETKDKLNSGEISLRELLHPKRVSEDMEVTRIRVGAKEIYLLFDKNTTLTYGANQSPKIRARYVQPGPPIDQAQLDATRNTPVQIPAPINPVENTPIEAKSTGTVVPINPPQVPAPASTPVANAPINATSTGTISVTPAIK